MWNRHYTQTCERFISLLLDGKVLYVLSKATCQYISKFVNYNRFSKFMLLNCIFLMSAVANISQILAVALKRSRLALMVEYINPPSTSASIAANAYVHTYPSSQ